LVKAQEWQTHNLDTDFLLRGSELRAYARFLRYCCDRIFLQKVGGGYIFIHRLLLKHFASLKIPRSN